MLKISCGFSRKTGEPGFSSRGASVHLELEAETQICTDPLSLHQRIEGLFATARAAVDRELARAASGSPARTATDDPATSSEDRAPEHDDERAGHRNGGPREPTASNRQLDFILHLVGDRQMSMTDLEHVCVGVCGIGELSRLTRPQASALITRLQESTGQADDRAEPEPQAIPAKVA